MYLYCTDTKNNKIYWIAMDPQFIGYFGGFKNPAPSNVRTMVVQFQLVRRTDG